MPPGVFSCLAAGVCGGVGLPQTGSAVLSETDFNEKLDFICATPGNRASLER